MKYHCNISNSYPFGMPMPGRQFNAGNYRFGFNGQEKDDEIYGIGSLNTAEFWQYDTRLGRRWNTDPIVKPWESSYLCFSGNPILCADPNGDDADKTIKTPNGETGTVPDNAKVSDDGKVASFPNGSSYEWNSDIGRYEPMKSGNVSGPANKSNPTYQEGTLWETDRGGQAIMPKDQKSMPSGWSYGGSGLFKTAGRTNMVYLMKNSEFAGLSLPRTNAAATFENCFKEGSDDAADYFLTVSGGIEGAAALALFGRVGFNLTRTTLRLAYEADVRAMASFAQKALANGVSEEKVAMCLWNKRRQLGVFYKNATPWAARQLIYFRNRLKYSGDILGPSFERVLKNARGDFQRVINSSTNPGGYPFFPK